MFLSGARPRRSRCESIYELYGSGCCFCIKRAWVLCSKVRSLASRLGGYFMYFKFMRKNCKKMLTDLSDYVNIFLACDAHVQCASGSVVEHLLAKEGAAGSIPVSRFFFYIFRSFLCLYIYMENLKIKTLS